LFELGLFKGICITLLAFISEYIDSTLGMGYGTALTPLLLLFGFKPLEVVPVVLLSEFITGLTAGFTHHSVGNVDFKPKTMNIGKIIKSLKNNGIVESFKKGIPLHLKLVILISICSIVGTVAAGFLAINLSTYVLKIYIGVLVFVIGIVIIITINMQFGFSWKKVISLGLVASFNKGISGGGYGPVVTGGQLLSGVEGKNAIGITSLAEGLTCFVGVIFYFLTNSIRSFRLAPFLVFGAVLSVPFSAITVKKIKTKRLRLIIGITTIILGAFSIYKTIF